MLKFSDENLLAYFITHVNACKLDILTIFNIE